MYSERNVLLYVNKKFKERSDFRQNFIQRSMSHSTAKLLLSANSVPGNVLCFGDVIANQTETFLERIFK